MFRKFEIGWDNLKETIEPKLMISDHSIEECVNIVNCNDSIYKNAYAEAFHSKDVPLLKKFLYCEKLNEGEKYNTAAKPEDFPFLCKFIEGIDTMVFLIDERIQELAEKDEISHNGHRVSVIDALYCSNVIVPRSDKGFSFNENGEKIKPLVNNNSMFDLNESEFKKSYEKIIAYLSGCIKVKDDRNFTKSKADFLLIHLGIIEKLIKSSNFNGGKKEKDDIKAFIGQKIYGGKETNLIDTQLIIISGRGKPSNLPDNILFLNYSIVSQYCFDNRLKLLLSNLIYSSKPL